MNSKKGIWIVIILGVLAISVLYIFLSTTEPISELQQEQNASDEDFSTDTEDRYTISHPSEISTSQNAEEFLGQVSQSTLKIEGEAKGSEFLVKHSVFEVPNNLSEIEWVDYLTIKQLSESGRKDSTFSVGGREITLEDALRADNIDEETMAIMRKMLNITDIQKIEIDGSDWLKVKRQNGAITENYIKKWNEDKILTFNYTVGMGDRLRLDQYQEIVFEIISSLERIR